MVSAGTKVPAISILYVDDESALLDIGKLYLEGTGNFIVDTAESAPAALEKIRTTSYDVIVSDYQMPRMDGIEFVKVLRASGNSTPFIIFTGKGREDVVIQAFENGVDFYLQKGGEPKAQFTELAHKVNRAVELRRAESERRESREALHESERKYRDLYRYAEVGLFETGLEGSTIKACNQKCCELFGFASPEEAIGKDTLRLFVNPADLDEVNRQLRETGKLDERVVKCRNLKTGDEFWAQVTAQLNREKDVAEGTIIDITEKREAEEALRESEERYHNIIEDQTEFVCRFLPDGTHVFVNGAYARYFGMDREKLIGQIFRPNIFPEDRENVRQFFTTLTPDHPVDFITHRIIMPNGEVRWQRWSDRAIFDKNGKIVEYQSVGRDITERRMAEEALRQSEKLYRSLTEASPDQIFILGRDDTVQFVNSAALKSLHLSYDQVIGKPRGTLFPPEMVKKQEAALQKVFETGENIRRENVFQFGKNELWIDTNLVPLTDEAGNVTSILGIARDITERKRAEETLRQSEERYYNIIEDQTEFVCRFLPDGTHVFVNGAYARYFGMDREKLIGQIFRANIFPDDREEFRQFFATLTPDHPVDFITHRIIMPDGEVRWQRWSDRAIFDKNGKIVEYQSVGRDITEQKQIEAELRDSEELRLEIIDHLPDMTFAINENGEVIAWNRAIEEFLGVKARDMIGKGNFEYAIPFYGERRPLLIDLAIHPDENLLRQKYDAISRLGEILVAETTFAHPLGRTAVLWAKVSPLYDKSGRLIGAIETIRDITERKQEETKLRHVNRQLNLLSSITRHDILNQLLALKGYFELSRNFLDNPGKMAEFLRKEGDAAYTIEALILLTKEYQDLGLKKPEWQIVDTCIARATTNLPLGGIAVETGNSTLEVFADPLLDRVFYNLIDNAIRHGGSELTRIRFSSQESDTGLVLVCEDNGAGVPAGEKEGIFNREFYTHTGFGLYLSREILGITGITIIENGEPGKGARFEIAVPKDCYRISAGS